MPRKYNNSRKRQLATLNDLVKSLRPPSLRAEGRPRSERRAIAREKKIPKDRRCPRCGEVVLKSRSWVISSDNEAICLACHRKESKDL